MLKRLNIHKIIHVVNRCWGWGLDCSARRIAQESVFNFLSQFHSPGGGFIHAFQSLTNESSLIQIFLFVIRIAKALTGLNPSKRFYFVCMPESIQNDNYQEHKIRLYTHQKALSSNGYPLFSRILCTLSGSLQLEILLFYFNYFFLAISVNTSPKSRLYFFLFIEAGRSKYIKNTVTSLHLYFVQPSIDLLLI